MIRFSSFLLLLLLLLLLVLACNVAVAQKAVPCVNKNITNTHITQHQFDAMVDFTFNVGCKAFRTSTLLKDVNRGDMVGASNQFMKWVYVNGQVNKGLVSRRTAERKMFEEK